MNSGYIYYIEFNKQYYVGQSIDYETRWIRHKNDLKNNCHHSWKLQTIYNKYPNINLFKFKVIEEVPYEKLDAREKYWSDFYQSVDKGYNVADVGKQYMPWTVLNKCVYVYDYNGNYLNMIFNSARECARTLGIDQSLLNKILNGTRHSAKGVNGVQYRFSYQFQNKLPSLQIINGNAKPVLMLDNNGNILQEFISIAAASRETGISKKIISNKCNKKTNRHYEYTWCYK